MATVCTYQTKTIPRCTDSATHRVVKGWKDKAWRIAIGDTDNTSQHYAIPQTPEFCLRHAGDVMQQRNAPPPLARILPRARPKEVWVCAVCGEELGVASYQVAKVGRVCGNCQQAYRKIDELAPKGTTRRHKALKK